MGRTDGVDVLERAVGNNVGSVVGVVGTTDRAEVGELMTTCTTAPPMELTVLLPVFAERMDT